MQAERSQYWVSTQVMRGRWRWSQWRSINDWASWTRARFDAAPPVGLSHLITCWVIKDPIVKTHWKVQFFKLLVFSLLFNCSLSFLWNAAYLIHRTHQWCNSCRVTEKVAKGSKFTWADVHSQLGHLVAPRMHIRRSRLAPELTFVPSAILIWGNRADWRS